MRLGSKALGITLCAVTFTVGLARAADNIPTVISPTSTPYAIGNGIAPNGIDATGAGIFFTQPYADGLQPRGAFTITPGGAVTLVYSIPNPGGGTAENDVHIASLPTAASGFTPGDVFSTAASPSSPGTNDAVYKNGVLFIDGISASLSHHQTALDFDTVGSFNGALIVTHDQSIDLYNGAGALLAHYTIPASSSAYVLQAATVAPLSYAGGCAGCIFVTAMKSVNIDAFPPTCCGEILTVPAGAVTGTVASFLTATTGPEPESIQFITSTTLQCTVGGFSYFATGYATDSQFNGPSTTGAILAWTPAQLTAGGAVGHYLLQNEEDVISGSVTHGVIYLDAGPTVFSQTTTPTNSVGYQLEDSAAIDCLPTTFSGCTVTQGGWGAPAHGNNPGTFLNSHFAAAYPSGVTIGGGFTLKFTSAAAVRAFLPQGGPPSALNASATNPTSRTSAGVFAGQVLALQLNVDLYGLGSKVLSGTGTSLDGKTVSQILAIANAVLGGGALPAGFSSISSLNDLVDSLNGSFDGCSPQAFASHLS